MHDFGSDSPTCRRCGIHKLQAPVVSCATTDLVRDRNGAPPRVRSRWVSDRAPRTDKSQTTPRINWRALRGAKLETLTAQLFSSAGYTIGQTPATRDGGVDLTLHAGSRFALVQCKGHNRHVGPAPIRELYGLVMAESAACGIFVAPNGFSVAALNFAQGKPLVLLTARDLASPSSVISLLSQWLPLREGSSDASKTSRPRWVSDRK